MRWPPISSPRRSLPISTSVPARSVSGGMPTTAKTSPRSSAACEIQSGCPSDPERCVIAHPFNPPHLIPLVEIVGGAKTSEETIRRAAEFYTSIGQRTVRLNKEMPGHVANRLQAALAREVYYLVSEG